MPHARRHLPLPLLTLTALAALLLAVPACGGGGGGGGPGPDGAGQGLVLMTFTQAGQDNVPINRVLTFVFSEAVDPDTIGAQSIQIREGPSYGLTASGEFYVDPDRPNVVEFRPDLLTVCGDATAAGFAPGTTYKVTFVGYPEEFAITNSQGQSLVETRAAEFSTRPETDPEYLEDQIPGQAPYVVSRTPTSGTAACAVSGEEAVDEIALTFSENLDPCSVDKATVQVQVYAFGGATPGEEYPVGSGRYSGFVPVEDSLPDDPTSWGGNEQPLADPQTVICDRILEQDFETTRLRLVPAGGQLPENSLIVVTLTFGVTDFGGTPLAPEQFSFTTENTPARESYLEIPFDATTPVDTESSTADLNSARSPDRAQGWMLFAGDGDNGMYDNVPAYPLFNHLSYAWQGCSGQLNDGIKDDFNPPSGNHTLHTGATRVPQSCLNNSDASTAVEWEFRSFRIRAGVRVTILGENPAIIKSLGDIVIENGGELIVAGGDGEDGHSFSYYDTQKNREGGPGYAGGGDGGQGNRPQNGDMSYDGFAGYGSDDYYVAGTNPGGTGIGQGGLGAGEAGVGAEYTTSYFYSTGQSGQGGGGGGHGSEGQDGSEILTSPYTWATTPTRGDGGDIYPDSSNADQLLTPSAGSGGGGGGWAWMGSSTDYTYYYYGGEGGAGGAGGGFVDLTSQGNIQILGMIDARGGDGGDGGIGGYAGGGGGGGGSGGGVRLLTPEAIDVSNGAILTTGGRGGTGSAGQYGQANYGGKPNDGGDGGYGRIALEDGDSVIGGLNSASLVPAPTQDGFYAGAFQSTRFVSGATVSMAQTDYMFLGPISPPTFQSLDASNFVAGIPQIAERGTQTAMVVDIQGRPMLPDGSVDMSAGAETGWFCIGYFTPGETPTEPDWTADAFPPPADVAPDYNQSDTSFVKGYGITNVPPCSYVQVRIHFWVPEATAGFGPQDPGPYVDTMQIPFTSDN